VSKRIDTGNTAGAPADAARARTAGLVALFATTLLFSWGAIIVKLIDLPASVLSFWRLLIGTVCLSSAARLLHIPWPRRWRSLVGAGLSFGAHQLAWMAAVQQTPVATVTLLFGTQPLIVAAVSRRTVGERVSGALVMWASMALVGIGIVVQANLGYEGRSLGGDLLACLNVLFFVGYFLLAKKARLAGAPTLTLTASFLGIAMLVVGPFALVTEGVGLPSARDWGMLTLLALGPGNGHLLLSWAHPRVSAALSSLVITAMPLFSTIWAHLVFGEPLGWRHMAGIALVAAALEGGRREEKRRKIV